jgi:hypothetical protein
MRRHTLRLISGEVAAAVLASLIFCGVAMGGTFSYGPSSSPPTLNPPIDYIRGLIADTVEYDAKGNRIYIWSDQEIQMFTQMQTSTFQSSQFFSGPAGRFVAPTPVAYLRVAAYMLNAQAANRSKMAGVEKLLDVTLDLAKASDALRTQAQEYLEMDDNTGAFFIAEQVNDMWSFRDRFWKQVQRQSGGGGY